jgi:V/A-type H+-transporting ATPase subunit G/H
LFYRDDEVKFTVLYLITSFHFYFRKEVAGLAGTIADEVRVKEAAARDIVASAKSEGAHLLASARAAGEQAVKEARQKSHRYFREQVKSAEGEAEAEAKAAVENGRADAERFYAETKPRTFEVAEWLVKEVMSAYGD